MRLTWFGHSCFLLETGAHRLLFDPYLSGSRTAPIKARDVACDYVLCSHAHEDHLGDSIDICRRTGATFIAAYELAHYVGSQGIPILDLMPGGGWDLPFGRVGLTPAIHSSALEQPNGGNLPLGNPAGFLVQAAGKTVYHAGDTALFSDMKLIGRANLDLALLPIGDRYTMGIRDAVAALDLLLPRATVPMHYGTDDNLQADPRDFARLAAEAGHVVHLPKAGEGWEF